MRTLWRCRAAGLAALLGAWLLPAAAVAQADPDKLRVEEHRIYEIEMESALRECNVQRFDRAFQKLKALEAIAQRRSATESGRETIALIEGYKYVPPADRGYWDAAMFGLSELVRYWEERRVDQWLCPAPIDEMSEVTVSAVGGSTIVSSSGESFKSTDILRVPDPTVTQRVDSSQSLGAGGLLATIRITRAILVRTGAIFSAKAKDEKVSDLTGVPKAYGTVNDPPQLTVPLLVGFSVPTSMFGLNVSGLSAQFFAGANINQRHASINLVELGAGPLGRSVSVSDTWVSVDPAFSIGLQYLIGRLGASPVSVGATVMFDWARSHPMVAPSPNFGSQSYTLETGRQRDTMVMVNVSIGLGGGAPMPPPPRTPMYVKAPPLK